MARRLTTLVLIAALITSPVKAEKVVIYREGQLVNPQDVAAVLGQTRSIRLLDDSPAATKSVAAQTSARRPGAASDVSGGAVIDASALALPVRFAFDSAEILPAARSQLDALAEGIKLLAPDSIVTVEGHTDAVGIDTYNLELSRDRARAVRDYLVQRHGIDTTRLKTIGYGAGRPIEDVAPDAAVNRRVQFRSG